MQLDNLKDLQGVIMRKTRDYTKLKHFLSAGGFLLNFLLMISSIIVGVIVAVAIIKFIYNVRSDIAALGEFTVMVFKAIAAMAPTVDGLLDAILFVIFSMFLLGILVLVGGAIYCFLIVPASIVCMTIYLMFRWSAGNVKTYIWNYRFEKQFKQQRKQRQAEGQSQRQNSQSEQKKESTFQQYSDAAMLLDAMTVMELRCSFKELTQTDLMKQRRMLVKKYHPDNGGSVEKMQEINQYYEYLMERIKKRKP
jgi:hypothetical protein